MGKYRVNLADLEAFGVNGIVDAVERSDIVAIDEIGLMELFSPKFSVAVETALKSSKNIIAVVHWKARDRLVDEMRTRENVEIFAVTAGNRDRLDRIISERIR